MLNSRFFATRWRGQPGRLQTALALLALTMPAARAQPEPATQPTGQKLLTFEEVFGPEGRVNFNGEYRSGMRWLPDGRSYLHRRDGVLQKVDLLTDEGEPAYDIAALEAALLVQGDFDEEAARTLAKNPGEFSGDRASVLIRHKGGLYFYRFADRKLSKIAEEGGPRDVLSLSPSAGYVAFVRAGNLFTVETASGRQQQLTRDGGELLLNGILDWVYQEEVYGRGNYRGYWWRADDAFLAYLQLDETGVPIYTIVDEIPTRPNVERTQYPKAGDPNPKVRLGVVRAGGGPTAWVDLSRYGETELLIVHVSWAPDGKLIYQVQDREQRWLDLCDAEPETGRSRVLFRECSPAWVNVTGEPHWLIDGTFLWLSERVGWQHIYHYRRDGMLLRRVTSGAWEVRELHGVDAKTGWVYFSGTADSPIESHAYRVRLDGGRVERLTEPGYSHSVSFDAEFRFFFDTFSNITTPTKVYLRKSDGGLARVISENEMPVLKEYKLGTPEFLRVPARDGRRLNAMILRPPDFDPSKKYPVWSSTYGGPHSPSVRNRWAGNAHMFDQMLAQKGIIVWVCDPRSASGEGAVSAWQCYQRLGESELSDLEDGVKWLVDTGYVDPRRIGLNGWSYGGFLTAFALTHSTAYSLGIAGGSVTDWRNYDTIYTEKYMRTPQNNPDGYSRTSVVAAAKNLHGRLLLVHGSMDDNVHFQNTMQLIFELQKAGKTFDLMVYPRNRHGIGVNGQHWNRLRCDYILENL